MISFRCFFVQVRVFSLVDFGCVMDEMMSAVEELDLTV